jgi:hypothetical protein
MVLDGPAMGTVTRAEPPAGARSSTTSDAVTGSKTAASPTPASGRTEPSGVAVTGGETAASAGEIVGGGPSVGLDEHDRQATIVTITRRL